MFWGIPIPNLDTSYVPPVIPVLNPYFSQAICSISLSMNASYNFFPFSVNAMKQWEFQIVGFGYNITISSFT